MDCCRVMFNSLKVAFLTTLILMHWNPNLPVIVETDVSDCKGTSRVMLSKF